MIKFFQKQKRTKQLVIENSNSLDAKQITSKLETEQLNAHKLNISNSNSDICSNSHHKILSAEKLLGLPMPRNYLEKMSYWVSVSDEYFDRYYRLALTNYASLVQLLPFPNKTNPNNLSMLNYTLDDIYNILRRRKSELLPENAAPEKIEVLEGVYTYAAFTAGLLKNVDYLLTHFDLWVFSDKKKYLGKWDVFSGPISEGNNYQFRVKKRELSDERKARPRDQKIDRVISLLLARQIIPDLGLRWLNEDSELFENWISVVTGSRVSNLARVVYGTTDSEKEIARNRTAKKLNSILLEDIAINSDNEQEVAEGNIYLSPDEIAEKINSSPDNFLANTHLVKAQRIGKDREAHDTDNFLNWIIRGIRNKLLSCNQADSIIHVVQNGVVLVSPAIFRKYAELEFGSEDLWQNLQHRFLRFTL